jgi:hypothetical protein
VLTGGNRRRVTDVCECLHICLGQNGARKTTMKNFSLLTLLAKAAMSFVKLCSVGGIW